MRGFFPVAKSEGNVVRIPLVAQCGVCGLFRSCHSPKMPVFGKGKKRILLVGEGPGKSEDAEGVPFIGESGQLLRDSLASVGIRMDSDCWRTNSVICRPHDAKGGNRKPTKKEISYCRPNLIKTIQELQPEIIIPLGTCAVHSLIGWLWKEDPGAITRWVGWQIPNQRLNAWICPTWHPAYILRKDGSSERESPVEKMLFQEHLKKAGSLQGRPWEEVPDCRKRVRCVLDPDEAAEYIQQLAAQKKPLAWDLETTALKPDSEQASIVCCSISNGDVSYAFPWYGQAITAMLDILASPDVPKIGYHCKFEHRWMLAKYRLRVCNWVWDGMLASHVLDNRKEITGLKFQSFVLLGQDSYNREIEPYLKGKGGANSINRIREVDLNKLLLYCGMDALLEYLVAIIQAKQLNIELC